MLRMTWIMKGTTKAQQNPNTQGLLLLMVVGHVSVASTRRSVAVGRSPLFSGVLSQLLVPFAAFMDSKFIQALSKSLAAGDVSCKRWRLEHRSPEVSDGIGHRTLLFSSLSSCVFLRRHLSEESHGRGFESHPVR